MHLTVFKIYFRDVGQGRLGEASRQQLDSVFGTAEIEVAIAKLLELADAVKPGRALPKGYDGKNDSKYVFNLRLRFARSKRSAVSSLRLYFTLH